VKLDDIERYRTPGQLIEASLKERGWSQRILAIVLGVNETVVNKIVNGKRALDAKTALALSELFGMPADSLLHLQKQYELAQARIVSRPDPGRANRAHLFGTLPVSDMLKRGWIAADGIRDVPKVESALARFFGVESPEQIEILPHAAKETNVFGGVSPAQLAWLYRVKVMASEMLVPRYSKTGVQTAIPRLRELLVSPEAARKVPRVLAECGVRYLIVQTLAGAEIDGVCFWLDDKSPVIAMTMRYDRIDNFWFVLRHELEHVLRGDGRQEMMLDAGLEGERAGTSDDLPAEERRANEAAAEFCVPQKRLKSFIARKAPFFKHRDIVGFARTINVHPGLVAGQLQHQTKRYDRFRDHLVAIRSVLLPNALVDGWGNVAPVD